MPKMFLKCNEVASMFDVRGSTTANELSPFTKTSPDPHAQHTVKVSNDHNQRLVSCKC